jgi:hypothetical protein
MVHIGVLGVDMVQGELISDSLISGLEIAARANPGTRTAEPLLSFFQHGRAMNETECYGSLKAVLHNGQLSVATRDQVLLEWMRHVVRHKLHVPYDGMVTASR